MKQNIINITLILLVIGITSCSSIKKASHNSHTLNSQIEIAHDTIVKSWSRDLSGRIDLDITRVITSINQEGDTTDIKVEHISGVINHATSDSIAEEQTMSKASSTVVEATEQTIEQVETIRKGKSWWQNLMNGLLVTLALIGAIFGLRLLIKLFSMF